jgi:hypothetical protein
MRPRARYRPTSTSCATISKPKRTRSRRRALRAHKWKERGGARLPRSRFLAELRSAYTSRSIRQRCRSNPSSGVRAGRRGCLKEPELPRRVERRDQDSQRSTQPGNVEEELLGGDVEQKAVGLPYRLERSWLLGAEVDVFTA